MSEVGPGDHIAGRYVLLKELGGGGMGIVFLARDEQGGREVAVKVLRLSNADAARRLRREARATEGLDPERIARVYDVGETAGGHPFLAMEYIEGRTLRAVLREGPLERSEALRVLREIATTLGGAHRAGLVHRDVKPDNIMVRGDGRVVVLDFGIVKHLDLSDDVAQITTQLTFEGSMMGTPAYLAPEQALGHEITPAVDQFALGVTAFELLTGRLPWTGTDVTRVLAQLLADHPPPVSTLNRTVPSSFDAVLWRALSKSPQARFPSVEVFASALEAAERGEGLVSPASQTVDGPAPALTPASNVAPASPLPEAQPPAKPRRSLRRTAPVVALIAATAISIGVSLVRRRGIADSKRSSGPPTLVLATSNEAPLACPIFVVEGFPEFASRLGAAASSLACLRAKWYLGGSDEAVLVPAALLDAPAQPRRDLPDFLASPGARARTLEVAKARALSTLDGTIARGRDTWRVDLVVRAPDGAEIARSTGSEATYLEPAIRAAVARLWKTAPLASKPIDPEVARWTAFPDIDAGLAELDLRQVGAHEEACADIRRRGPALGLAYFPLSVPCAGTPPADGGEPVLDESTAPALVTSFNAVWAHASVNPFSDAEMRRLALKMESMRASETSRLGRASLDFAASLLWSVLRDGEHAHATLLSAVGDDPLFYNAWSNLVTSAWDSSGTATSLASLWFPQEPEFLATLGLRQSDGLEARLREGQLAYILEPSQSHMLSLGQALAEANRPEEVRALTIETPVDRSAPDPAAASVLLACIDLHDARFARALARFEGARALGLPLVPTLAGILGQTTATGTRWATSFLSESDAKARILTRRNAAAAALCMSAEGPLAIRCLSRLEKLGEGNSLWDTGEDALLLGAKRFASGDVEGAVNVWRPIVGGPDDDLLRLLPTSAFERAGEPDLAARIDDRKMAYRQFAGVSEAAPRVARRAFEHGDKARAKELANAVVQAWEVADAPIPAVAEMRALLAKIGD